MGITHLIGGLEVAGVPTLGMSGIPATAGNVWFVNSVTGSDGNTGAADNPFATLAHAIVAASADNGDIIVLEAAHAESGAGAGAWTINKSGITVWGLGYGADRPTFTIPSTSSTATTFLVTSNNFTLGGNVVFVNQKASLVTFFSIQAADCNITAECHDNAVGTAALIWVSAGATTTATRLTANLTVYGFSNASPVPTALVSLTGPSIDSQINLDCYGKWSTAVVNFVTTAVINCNVTGFFANASNTTLSAALDVVDTVTGSTWTIQGFDATADDTVLGGNSVALSAAGTNTIIADLTVPSANATTNVYERDVIGNKTDTGVTAVGTTKSIMAYAQGLVTMNTVQSANATNNAFAGDVIGNKTDAAVYGQGTTKSLMAYIQGILGMSEQCLGKAAQAITNAGTIFTVAGGPIEVIDLILICIVGADSTAATIQFESIPTVGSTVTISGASASLANVAAGTTVVLNFAATAILSTAPTIGASGAQAFLKSTSGIIIPAGTINTVVGSGPFVSATYSPFIRFRPLARGVTVT